MLKSQNKIIKKSWYYSVILNLIAIMIIQTQCGLVLNDHPIIFQMKGETTYIPDAGGSSKTGYKLTIGFSYYQWLAIEIVTGTNKNDVLVLQSNQFYTQGSTPLRTGHQVTVQDFYTSSDTLNYDQNTQNDISSFNYTQIKTYSLDMIRYLSSSSGQDWNAPGYGYSLMQVCFYTSDKLFQIETWKSGLSQCFYFQIDNYVSDFKGVKLKNFNLNGYTTGVYGWIDGPYINSNVYFYHQVPLFTYTKQPALIIQLGTTAGEVGQDFNAFSTIQSQKGDYYGVSTTSMNKDTSNAGGFQNGGLTLKSWNAVPAAQIPGLSFTALGISYRRNITTFDIYDKELKSTFIFCLSLYAVGSINGDLTDKSCEVLQLSYYYPRMSMPVTTTTWEAIQIKIYFFLIVLFFMLLNI